MKETLRRIQAAVTFVVILVLLTGNVGVFLPEGWTGLSVSVKAADVTTVPLNQQFDETDEAYFELPEHGVVTFEGNRYNAIVEIYKVLENGNEEQIASQNASRMVPLRLAPGKYKCLGAHVITKINFTPETKDTFEQEWNDSFDTANKIEPSLAYTGNLNCSWSDWDGSYYCTDEDYYKLELQQAGMVQIQYSIEESEEGNRNAVVLYNEDEDGNVSEICKVDDSKTDKTRYSKRYRLPKGIYYVKISSGDYGNWSNYQIKVNYEQESAADHEQEYNNTIEIANEISANIGYTGNIPNSEDMDCYKFTLPTTSRVKLKMQIPRGSKKDLLSASLYEEDGTNSIVKVNTTMNPVVRSEEQLLEAGNYYVLVEKGLNYRDAVDGNDIDYTLTVEAVGKILVQEITITSDKTEVHVGDSIQMTAAVSPDDAENKEVIWSCSDKSVVEIDSKGKVTCVGTGNVYITATAKDGSRKSASYLLTVTKVPVSSISIETYSDTYFIGDKVHLSVMILPTNVNAMDKDVVWDSNDESIAEVSDNGVITCKSAGTVTITATATDGSGVSASKAFTVLKAKSKNNYLSKLSISNGKLTPSFKKTKTSYNLVLKKQMSQVVIKAVAEDKKAVIKINSKKMKDNKITIRLKSGKCKTVKIQVTAENRKTKTYNIKVKRK